MAGNRISTVVNGPASGVGASRTGGKVQGSGRQTVLGPGAGGARGQTDRERTAPRQTVNVDGQIFDRGAPRGTYLDIVV